RLPSLPWSTLDRRGAKHAWVAGLAQPLSGGAARRVAGGASTSSGTGLHARDRHTPLCRGHPGGIPLDCGSAGAAERGARGGTDFRASHGVRQCAVARTMSMYKYLSLSGLALFLLSLLAPVPSLAAPATADEIVARGEY